MNCSAKQSDCPAVELIKAKRLLLQMTQKELADAVGMPKFGDRTIRRWENGESSPSNMELAFILSLPEVASFPNNEDASYTMVDLLLVLVALDLVFIKQENAGCIQQRV